VSDPQAPLLEEIGDELIEDWAHGNERDLTVYPGALEARAALPKAVRLLDAQQPEPPEWIVDRLIEAGEISFLAGSSGSFKSTVALAISCCVSGGHEAFDHFPVTQGSVLYVSEEDPEGRIRNRGLALAKGHGWSFDSINNVYVLARKGARLEDSAWQGHIQAVASGLTARLIVLDPLRDLTLADENSNTEMAGLIRFARSCCELASRPAVVFLHHFGKQTECKRTALDRVRGASSLVSAARCAHTLAVRDGHIRWGVVKMTDSDCLPPFDLQVQITEHQDYAGLWHTARLDYTPPAEAECGEAHQAVLEVLDGLPKGQRFSRNELRKAVLERTSISPVLVNRAIGDLQSEGRIEFIAGPRRAHLYALSDRSPRLGVVGRPPVSSPPGEPSVATEGDPQSGGAGANRGYPSIGTPGRPVAPSCETPGHESPTCPRCGCGMSPGRELCETCEYVRQSESEA
jgi:hypothetical protein